MIFGFLKFLTEVCTIVNRRFTFDAVCTGKDLICVRERFYFIFSLWKSPECNVPKAQLTGV